MKFYSNAAVVALSIQTSSFYHTSHQKYCLSHFLQTKKPKTSSGRVCVPYDIPVRHASIEPVKQRLKKWIDWFVCISNAWVEKVSPDAKKYLDSFYKGIRITVRDVQTYHFVKKRLKVNPAASVSYTEEMRMLMLKRDAWKVVPIIPFCIVPFGFIMLFFPIYFFPRYVLPQAYWSESQRNRFYRQFHQERLRHYEIIIHHLNFHRKNSSKLSDARLLSEICSAIQSNNVPSNGLLMQLRPLCNSFQHPLNLEERKDAVLLRSFSKVVLVSPFMPTMMLCSHLQSYVNLIVKLDQKLRSSNVLDKLSDEELQLATLLRGLDCANLSREANLYWLKNWIELTSSCDSSDTWFIMHAMVLLSLNYNQIKFQRRAFG